MEEGAMIDLHYCTTPNRHKVTIFLEEAGLPYRIIPVNLGRGDQFKSEFLRCRVRSWKIFRTLSDGSTRSPQGRRRNAPMNWQRGSIPSRPRMMNRRKKILFGQIAASVNV
jgi:hypothetical protein